MRFGYTIIYVADVLSTIDFYKKAFNIPVGFLHESQQYAELDTGTVRLGFAAEEFMQQEGVNFTINRKGTPGAGVEIAFVTENVAAAFTQAIAAGANSISEPALMPWGQTVARVNDNNGFIVEICSPMA